MALLCFVADVHVANHRKGGGPLHAGMNRRCREVLATLRAAYNRAVALQASGFTILGDLFDHERPSPQIITAAQDIFPLPEEDESQGPMPIVVKGNHDMASSEADDHALGPLQDRCMVVDNAWKRNSALWRAELVLVPYQPGPAKTWLPVELMKINEREPRDHGPIRVLGIHLGIMDGQTPEYLKDADDAIDVDTLEKLCVQYGFSYVFAGNWHDRRVWKRPKCHIVQVGTLCPTGWDNPGIGSYGFMAVLDTETGAVTYEQIPGPRFLKAEDPDGPAWAAFLKTIRDASDEGNSVYVESRHRIADLEGARKELLEMQSSGELASFDARLSEKEARAASRRAAEAVKSSSNMREAFAGYMKSVPLPEGADRKSVRKRVEQYLGFV